MKLTDEMIQEAGKEAMDMRLSAIENEEIPEHEFSEEFSANMAELIRSQKDRKRKAHTVWVWRMARVAAVFALVVVSLSVSSVSLEASRNRLIDVDSMIIGKSEIKFKLTSSEGSTGELGEITFEYLPEGMVEVDCVEDEELMDRSISFADEEDWTMCFHQLEVASTKDYLMELDIYEMEESVVYINGIEATLYTKDEWRFVDGEYTDTGRDYSILLWQEDTFFFELSGYVSAEEIIQVAEGIKIN